MYIDKSTLKKKIFNLIMNYHWYHHQVYLFESITVRWRMNYYVLKSFVIVLKHKPFLKEPN